MVNYQHSSLGYVRVRVSRSAKSFVATWKPGYLQVTVPLGATMSDVGRALDEMAPRLLKVRPAERGWFADGVVIDCGELKITYKENRTLDHCCIYNLERVSPRCYEAVVQFSADADWTTALNLKGIKGLSLNIMHKVAADVLCYLVEDVFRRCGVRPKVWSISRGQRILGTCSANGEIKISCAVMMLPRHLREFIVCHEAAHLTHQDHSPAFHALVNRYTGGREKELIKELKAFEWPLPRM